MTGTSIFHIIVSKFSHKKEPSLIVLFAIDKNLVISLYYTLLSLGLAISFKVESSAKPLFYLKEVA